MPNLEPFAVIGGDRRMDHLSKYLLKTRPVVRWMPCQPLAALEEALAIGQHLIFPMPFSRDGEHISGTDGETGAIPQLLPMLRRGHRSLFGGQIPPQVHACCGELGIRCFDWMEMEDVALPNAVLTAEAAIAETVLRTGHSLSGANCLILGYGRCGQALARRLRYLTSSVTVAARNPFQRLSAQSEGFSALALSGLFEELPRFDLLFNTIPAMVLPGKSTCALPPDAVLLDLASGPLSSHAEIDGCRCLALSCPGLPGKYFPKDAGEILARAVLSRLAGPIEPM